MASGITAKDLRTPFSTKIVDKIIQVLDSSVGSGGAIQDSGVDVTPRTKINFLVGFTVVDDPINDRIDITSLAGVPTKYELPFTFADHPSGSLPIGPIPAGSVVEHVMLEVDVPFDNAPTCTVGDAIAQGRFLAAADSSLAIADQYFVTSGYAYGVATPVAIYFGGGVPTVGSGRVIVFLSS